MVLEVKEDGGGEAGSWAPGLLGSWALGLLELEHLGVELPMSVVGLAAEFGPKVCSGHQP